MQNYHDAIEQIQEYQAALNQQASSAEEQTSLVSQIQEELQIASEELRVANQELIEANEAIAAERQRYRDLFEFAPDGYLITDFSGRILEANYAAARLLQVRAEFLAEKPMVVFVADAERDKFRNHLIDLRQLCQHSDWTLQLQEWNILLKPRTGEPFHASLHVMPVRDRASQAITFRWLLRDITPQAQAEAELRRALCFEATLRSITDQIRSSLNEAQILQTVVEELTAVLQLRGCDAALYNLEQQTATIQYECTVAIPSTRGMVIEMDQFPAKYGQLLQGICFQFCGFPDAPYADERRSSAVLACPIADDQQILGDLWLFRQQNAYFDETEARLVKQIASQCAIAIRQARLYQTAQKEVKAMERLNRLKDEFLSTVSHELRTPITNMQMALRMLSLSDDPDRRRRYQQILQNECDREAELISNMLDLQELEANDYPQYIAEAIDLQSWLPQLAETWRSRMAERQQNFKLILPESIPFMVADRASLGRVLSELLSNTYKYTPIKGQIRLTVDLLPSNQAINLLDINPRPDVYIVFHLQNQAEIAAESLPHIFDKFYRAPENDLWGQSGTGLGLTLVQKLVEGHMHGSIQVTSQSGWTHFSIQLPIHLSPPLKR